MWHAARPRLGMHVTVLCWQVREVAPPGHTIASGLYAPGMCACIGMYILARIHAFVRARAGTSMHSHRT